MKLGRIVGIGIVLLVIAGFLSASLVQAAGKLPKQASIGTHRVGGIFHRGGVGIAKVLSSHTPIKVVVKPYSGPGTYMALLNRGEIDMGLPNSLDTKYAFEGNPLLYKERMINERVLLPGGFNIGLMPITARKDSGIKTIADLKGRRVCSGFGGNPVMSLQGAGVLALGGLTWDDVVKVPCVDYKASLKAIREGRAEAGFTGTYYGAATLEMSEAVPLQALRYEPSRPEYQKRFNEILPGFKIFTIPPSHWLTGPTTVLGYKINLVACAGLSEDAGYLMVETLYKRYKELNAVGGILKTWNPEVFLDTAPSIPYHDGTVKYYKKKKMWTKELEKLQKQLLTKAK